MADECHYDIKLRYERIASWADCRVMIKDETIDQLNADSLRLGRDESAGKRSLLFGGPGRSPDERGRFGLYEWGSTRGGPMSFVVAIGLTYSDARGRGLGGRQGADYRLSQRRRDV
jgi:hypothetical protein